MTRSFLGHALTATVAAALGAYAGGADDVARLLSVPALVVGAVFALCCATELSD